VTDMIQAACMVGYLAALVLIPVMVFALAWAIWDAWGSD